MKESISYSFLLNIIILFIFVCAAIITGIFSYYRAFKANNIITSEIEKYEGYNCESKKAIERRLSGVSYNVPFNVKCKSSDKNCVTDDEENGNYAVVAYNLDHKNGIYAFDDNMNSNVSNDGYTRNYQYGIYTYMYVDLPVVSSIIRIPVFSKTRELHEFRRLTLFKDVALNDKVIDYNYFPDSLVDNSDINFNQVASEFSMQLLKNATSKSSGGKFEYGFDPDDFGNGSPLIMLLNYREAFKYYDKSISSVQSMLVEGRHACGTTIDWSIF